MSWVGVYAVGKCMCCNLQEYMLIASVFDVLGWSLYSWQKNKL